MKLTPEILLLKFAQLALLVALFAGGVAALQYLNPNFIPALGFQKLRPIHVTFATAWIIGSAVSIVWIVLKNEFKIKIKDSKLELFIPYLFVITGVVIFIHYLVGKFGGREYWEFPPYMSLGIFATWIFFLIVFVGKLRQIKTQWPVYLWMWLTGVIFFFITFAEANFWIIDYFRNDIIKDITIQWKSQGALVGSWNMLVYGISMFLSEKISGNKKVSRNNIAFASFILGFTNLLLGWAHHIYIVPCPMWIRMLSYAISMTELILIAKIIKDAFTASNSKNVSKHTYLHEQIYYYAERWIKYNLFLAVLISVPAINIYTHGTHVTVAHAMGSTIGINTFILLAAIAYLTGKKPLTRNSKIVAQGVHVSLLIFWLALIGAGVTRGLMAENGGYTFYEISEAIKNYIWVFIGSGLVLFLFLSVLILKNIGIAKSITYENSMD